MPVTDQGGGALDFQMQTAYPWVEGLMQLPVCGTRNDGSEQSVQVRLHSPVGSKTISWSVRSVGMPKVPHPADLDPDSVFLGSSITGAAPLLDGAGNHLMWSISGTYTYALKKPHGLDRPYQFGSMPGSASGGNDDLLPNAFDRLAINVG